MKLGATVEGTLRFSNNRPRMKFSRVPRSGLYASRIGIGTFRLHKAKEPSKLISDALDTGYNVFDTAPNFAKGECELLLGMGLKSSRNIQRDEYILLNKVGFVPPNTPKFPDMYEINRVKYCLHPEYLEYQLTESLKRMQQTHFDLYLLNNPERVIHAPQKDYTIERCYDEIQRAFEHLKLEQGRGRIGQFGLTSNTMALKDTPDHLDIKILQRLNSISVVQYPLNLFEPDAVFAETSLANECQTAEIYQLTQRPLLAITPIGVHRLSNSNIGLTEAEINKATQSLFTEITDLEYIIGTKSILY